MSNFFLWFVLIIFIVHMVWSCELTEQYDLLTTIKTKFLSLGI